MLNNKKVIAKFQAIPSDFTFFDKKISINKFELSKAVNVNSQSGEAGYTLVPKSYDKENRKDEDELVNDMNEWMKDCESNLKDELKRFYEDLDY